MWCSKRIQNSVGIGQWNGARGVATSGERRRMYDIVSSTMCEAMKLATAAREIGERLEARVQHTFRVCATEIVAQRGD